MQRLDHVCKYFDIYKLDILQLTKQQLVSADVCPVYGCLLICNFKIQYIPITHFAGCYLLDSNCSLHAWDGVCLKLERPISSKQDETEAHI